MQSLLQHLFNHVLKRANHTVKLASNDRFYTYYQLSEAEIVNEDVPQNASPMPFAAAKGSPIDGEPDWGSYRTVPENHPIEALETCLIEYDPAQCQAHFHVWPELVTVHYELRGDPWPVAGESPSEFYDRIQTHLRPTWDKQTASRSEWTYLRGVTA